MATNRTTLDKKAQRDLFEKHLQTLREIKLENRAKRVDQAAKKQLFNLCDEVGPYYCAFSELGEGLKRAYTLHIKTGKSTSISLVPKWDIIVSPSFNVGQIAALFNPALLLDQLQIGLRAKIKELDSISKAKL